MMRRVAIALGLVVLAFNLAQAANGRGRLAARHERPHPVAAFQWLVPTTGAQPTIARENRSRGTIAWRLPGHSADVGGLAYGSISGYVSEEAVAPGQRERIYVSAPGLRQVRIDIYRMGWYGGKGGREVLRTGSLAIAPQPGCSHRPASGLTECHWRPTLSFMIPPALASGVYIAKLTGRGTARDCLFVVLGHPEPLLAQVPTSTYQAYNDWGGDSLYPGGLTVGVTGTSQGVKVSYDRPYDTVTGAGQFFARDVAMVRFLERYRYPVSYTTSESVDQDPRQLLNHRGVIDFGHSEYWSRGQRQGFTAALHSGVSLMFLGSDTMAWHIRYAPASEGASEAGQRDHTMIAYKEFAARDPDRSDPSGLFRDGGAALTGSSYVGCITPRLRVPGPPTYRYYEWSPAPALEPAWLFARTGITATTRIPGIVGYELDRRTWQTPPGTQLVGSGVLRVWGAQMLVHRRSGAAWRRRGNAVYGALRRPRVQLRNARLGAGPRTSAERLARRASCSRTPSGGADPKPARTRPSQTSLTRVLDRADLTSNRSPCCSTRT